MLLRRFVSRNAAWKGKAVLEGVGLPSEVRDMCYKDCPSNEVEAVQTGLIKWREGGGDSPTWTVLLEAMEYAKIGVQHIAELKEEILRGTHSVAGRGTSCSVMQKVHGPGQNQSPQTSLAFKTGLSLSKLVLEGLIRGIKSKLPKVVSNIRCMVATP